MSAPNVRAGYGPGGTGLPRSSDAPYDNPALITPSDATDNIAANCAGLIILASGTLSVIHSNGVTLPFGTLLAGQTIPISGLVRVRSTGTTATVAAGF